MYYTDKDLEMEHQIEVVRYIRFLFWKKKIVEWKPCTEQEWYLHKGRKRFRFVTLKWWKVVEPREKTIPVEKGRKA